MAERITIAVILISLGVACVYAGFFSSWLENEGREFKIGMTIAAALAGGFGVWCGLVDDMTVVDPGARAVRRVRAIRGRAKVLEEKPFTSIERVWAQVEGTPKHLRAVVYVGGQQWSMRVGSYGVGPGALPTEEACERARVVGELVGVPWIDPR
ncbi:MAG: hypothetical protein HY925_08600 [Elusimicrobia bacterium]|nr:hypothetical protein [Elusimicrobiota bacterium]